MVLNSYTAPLLASALVGMASAFCMGLSGSRPRVALPAAPAIEPKTDSVAA